MHHTFVSPLTPDSEHLVERAASPECLAAGERLEELLAGSRMVLRVDRIEPAKNLLRGFWAFDEMLRMRPELRGQVVLLALAYASRSSLPEYLAYGAEVEQAARQVNDTWGTDDWAPIILDVADDPGRSVAALMRYDVLLVNPLRDGLNLVAKEGPIVNTTDGVLAFLEKRVPSPSCTPRRSRSTPSTSAGTAGGAPPGARHGPPTNGPGGRGAPCAWCPSATPGTGSPTNSPR